MPVTIKKMGESAFHSLDIDADRALFEGQLQGLVITCYENERPLQGLAGLMDWRFFGAMSQCLKAGAITGKAGECVYFPISRNGETFHLILVGSGHAPSAGSRREPPAESIRALQKNLASLRLQKVGISRKDFGNVTNDYFTKNLKGVPLWIAP